MTITLGYGRWRCGRIGTSNGFNAYALRNSDNPWFGTGLDLHKTGKRYPLATTQQHNRMEGCELVRSGTLAAYRANPLFAHEAPPETTSYPDFDYKAYKWAMVIDLACLGCSACTIACQAENNIPVVGKREVSRGREMHWNRVDRYYQRPPAVPETYF